jgi:hypothetical protein
VLRFGARQQVDRVCLRLEARGRIVSIAGELAIVHAHHGGLLQVSSTGGHGGRGSGSGEGREAAGVPASLRAAQLRCCPGRRSRRHRWGRARLWRLGLWQSARQAITSGACRGQAATQRCLLCLGLTMATDHRLFRQSPPRPSRTEGSCVCGGFRWPIAVGWLAGGSPRVSTANVIDPAPGGGVVQRPQAVPVQPCCTHCARAGQACCMRSARSTEILACCRHHLQALAPREEPVAQYGGGETLSDEQHSCRA